MAKPLLSSRSAESEGENKLTTYIAASRGIGLVTRGGGGKFSSPLTQQQITLSRYADYAYASAAAAA